MADLTTVIHLPGLVSRLRQPTISTVGELLRDDQSFDRAHQYAIQRGRIQDCTDWDECPHDLTDLASVMDTQLLRDAADDPNATFTIPMQPVELRARRLALGLSQAQLADALDVKQAMISYWETGKRLIPSGIASDLAGLEAWVQARIQQYVQAGSSLITVDPDSPWDGMELVAAARAQQMLTTPGHTPAIVTD